MLILSRSTLQVQPAAGPREATSIRGTRGVTKGPWRDVPDVSPPSAVPAALQPPPAVCVPAVQFAAHLVWVGPLEYSDKQQQQQTFSLYMAQRIFHATLIRRKKRPNKRVWRTSGATTDVTSQVTQLLAAHSPDPAGSTSGQPGPRQTWPRHWTPTSSGTGATTHLRASRQVTRTRGKRENGCAFFAFQCVKAQQSKHTTVLT